MNGAFKSNIRRHEIFFACFLSLIFCLCCPEAMAADGPYGGDMRPDLTYPSKTAIDAWANRAFGGHWGKPVGSGLADLQIQKTWDLIT